METTNLTFGDDHILDDRSVVPEEVRDPALLRLPLQISTQGITRDKTFLSFPLINCAQSMIPDLLQRCGEGSRMREARECGWFSKRYIWLGA